MDKTNFTRLFDAFDRGASARFQPLRQAGRTRFLSLPLPTDHTEDWRFTSIAPLMDTAFELPGVPAALDPTLLPALPTPETLRLVFVNGAYVKALSAPADLPAGVQVGSLANSDVTPMSVGQIAGYQDQVFTALNRSFISDGAFVALQSGKIIAPPIEVLYVTHAAGNPLLTNPRVLILAGEGCQATVVERYFAVGEGQYFTNAVTEMVLAENAIVNHVKVQDESRQAFHVANMQVVLAARSNFTTHYLALGGALVRNEVRVRFDGEHAEATVNGLYMADGTRHLDNFTVIDHAKPNCASHELYKGILDGQSHGVFNGKIMVRKDAQKTDAKQTNKVLLLSNSATINTKPQLEIFADDVKCTHGATVGQLDANQMFYLQSRGIPLEEARRLLTFAFANDIVNRIKIEAIRAELEGRIVHQAQG